ncbi:helix-turn-helix domain-containing protein [Glutamicibacter protophormiae]|uniref:helix-turn-helix domain-containing protein n=1 Tax=Glutamicibacter protophormiae TaxID=37930 RepID=UPI003A8D75B4
MRDSPMGQIATRIRAARTARGWSQTHLAEAACVSRPTVARIERGDDMNTATLASVCEVLGLEISVQELDQ